MPKHSFFGQKDSGLITLRDNILINGITSCRNDILGKNKKTSEINNFLTAICVIKELLTG
ncbi:hypothetical protein GCM10008015_01410 [Flavobacterium palustre]|uniref:Uncharacterized protein n=1 Tax=Flavobacterium palustre TaxID=1476463 RepID=A0ABQ1H869_9FLAO|nr:hypothetical protein GCM10008015_01410 [Flavobacterium palustre]